jgi:putative ABC transport system substrate-binding protein
MRRRDFIIFLAGAMAAWPLAARAQQKAVPVIGYLGSEASGPSAPFVTAFLQGLNDTGFVEGQNLVIEYRWADGRYDRLPALVTDFVGRKVDVIAALGLPSALAAKSATSTIPIVFSVGDLQFLDLGGSREKPPGAGRLCSYCVLILRRSNCSIDGCSSRVSAAFETCRSIGLAQG